MTDIWELLTKMDCDDCSVHEDCDNDNLCAEWITKAKSQLLKLKEKAEKWDNIMEKSMEAPYIDCVENLEKLEAVNGLKSHLIEKYGRASNQLIRAYWVISELEKILEAEQ